ncbi:MAG: PKD domain-containing protein, partial [Bacteroidia bacterium]
IAFHALLQDAQYGVWDYGDASPTQTLSGTGSFTTTHVYAASGNYTATLTAYNALTGCPPSTFTTVVTVRKIKASFTNNSVSCKAIPSSYVSTSTDVMTACTTGYTWLFGNFPPVQTMNPATSYTLPAGIYTVHLIVRDTNNCLDTATKVVKISSVNVNVAMTPSVGCLPNFVVNTVNTSTSDTSAINYSWNFGDGPTLYSGTTPSHTYSSISTPPSQIFTVTVIATNGYGCRDTIRKTVQVNTQTPVLTSLGTPSICVGNTLTLLATNVPGVVSYTWNPGDASGVITNTTTTVVHSYSAAGIYTASVIVKDGAGCQGNSVYPVYVQNYPVPSFTYVNQCNSTSSVACTGCTILFQDNSVNPVPGPRTWDLATGGPIVGTQTVGTAYTTPGTYVITLTVTSSYGCASVAHDTLRVLGASADFTTDKNTVCKGEAIIFTIKDTSHVFTWHWDFGDGTDAGNLSPTSHSYTFHPPSGTTNASLIYWTKDSACKYSVVKPINIRNIIADFDRNNELLKKDSIHCLGVQDLFTSTSTSATAWSWNFGDGGTSSLTNPNHTYANPGTYTVTLAIADTQYGCKDTIRKPMWIIPPPVASIASHDTCANIPTTFTTTGSSGYTYIWHPGKNLNDSTLANPVATLTVPTTFTVEVTDPNGCTNNVTHYTYVQQPPKAVTWDTSVVIGQQIPIPGYAGTNFTYTWNPTKDLSCINCPYPVSTTTVDMTYTASIADNMGCYKIANTFSIHIEPLSSVDVPTAFTPNGDGINDIIYVDGWGIKKLNYFRVYNRWGQLLFESNDIKIGWDGFFNGAPQNMETYVYQVSVETYIDAGPKLKAGTFKLIR